MEAAFCSRRGRDRLLVHLETLVLGELLGQLAVDHQLDGRLACATCGQLGSRLPLCLGAGDRGAAQCRSRVVHRVGGDALVPDDGSGTGMRPAAGEHARRHQRDEREPDVLDGAVRVRPSAHDFSTFSSGRCAAAGLAPAGSTTVSTT